MTSLSLSVGTTVVDFQVDSYFFHKKTEFLELQRIRLLQNGAFL